MPQKWVTSIAVRLHDALRHCRSVVNGDYHQAPICSCCHSLQTHVDLPHMPLKRQYVRPRSPQQICKGNGAVGQKGEGSDEHNLYAPMFLVSSDFVGRSQVQLIRWKEEIEIGVLLGWACKGTSLVSVQMSRAATEP